MAIVHAALDGTDDYVDVDVLAVDPASHVGLEAGCNVDHVVRNAFGLQFAD